MGGCTACPVQELASCRRSRADQEVVDGRVPDEGSEAGAPLSARPVSRSRGGGAPAQQAHFSERGWHVFHLLRPCGADRLPPHGLDVVAYGGVTGALQDLHQRHLLLGPSSDQTQIYVINLIVCKLLRRQSVQ